MQIQTSQQIQSASSQAIDMYGQMITVEQIREQASNHPHALHSDSYVSEMLRLSDSALSALVGSALNEGEPIGRADRIDVVALAFLAQDRSWIGGRHAG